ncbi:two component transcriptional regulator, LytTR family [Lutibacter oricola]|uniref:Two component transcriptional regulator, LytTR family n=1 Tax=Lutibacter oricola TaxID=762486 RepID=A0A1H3D6K6_9FLAO|nr:LytTR family DNA-binding domain-containing protein [Lutibacter oricola]SDX61768.1 two component transcriptional regulator, LytTR family [Lutibacter oricola]
MRNYLIIDNNQNSIQSIKNVLNDYADFNFIGICNEYNTAMNVILKEAPDLVFFNIDNVIENPFEFTRELNLFNQEFPVFIAMSNSKDRLYEVIKNGFIDFLLKPLSELEIRKSALRVLKKIPARSRKHLCLKSYKDYQYLKTDEILFLKADNNTTDFYMNDGNIISAYKTLKTFESTLPDNFHRIHKSYIINKNFVSRIQYGKHFCSIKKNSYKVPFTKTYIKNIELINKALSGHSYQSLN